MAGDGDTCSNSVFFSSFVMKKYAAPSSSMIPKIIIMHEIEKFIHLFKKLRSKLLTCIINLIIKFCREIKLICAAFISSLI